MRRIFVALLAALAAPIAGAQPTTALQGEIRASAKIVIPATVRIQAEEAAQGILGSTGVLVDPRGLVLSDADATLKEVRQSGPGAPPTKVHAERATVFLPPPDGRSFPARLLRRDEATDSALLQVELPGMTRLPAVNVADSSVPALGTYLLVAGNAFGTAREGAPAVSIGIVSALAPPAKEGEPGRFYTNAPVNPGSNGGPVVDLGGNLLGIVSTFETAPTSPFRGLGLITPLSALAAVYEDLPEGKRLFGDRRAVARRTPPLAASLEELYAWLAPRAGAAVAGLIVDRGGEKHSTQIRVPQRQGPPRTVQIPVYEGPYSALCVDPAGLLVTSIAGLWKREKIKRLTVCLQDGRRLEATLVAMDQIRGIALLTVDPGAKPLTILPGTTQPQEPGTLALAVGRAWAGTGTPEHGLLLTSGVVSASSQGNFAMDALQVDAGLNDALAGGAVVNLKGELLGMGLLLNPDRTGRNSGIGFALPPATLLEAVARLRGGKDVERGWLGISLADGPEGEIKIAEVQSGGPADQAGLQKDDQLIALAGRKAAELVRSQVALGLLAAFAVGDTLDLEVRRDGRPLKLAIRLGARPGSGASAPATPVPETPAPEEPPPEEPPPENPPPENPPPGR